MGEPVAPPRKGHDKTERRPSDVERAGASTIVRGDCKGGSNDGALDIDEESRASITAPVGLVYVPFNDLAPEDEEPRPHGHGKKHHRHYGSSKHSENDGGVEAPAANMVASDYEIKEDDGDDDDSTVWPRRGPRTWRERIYDFLDDPQSSRWAMAWSVWLHVLILAAVLVVCLESVRVLQIQSDELGDVFFMVDTIIVFFFSIDYFGRLLTCPSKRKFFRSILNFIDLVSIIPYYVQIALKIAGNENSRLLLGLSALRVLRLIRLVGMLKWGPRTLLIRLFVAALGKGRDGILLLLFLMAILTVFFSTLMYTVEVADCVEIDGKWVYKNGQARGQLTFFQNIPITFWWCIVTLTTVGYGDTYPNTDWGRVVGALTMVTAIIMVAFPVTIIGQAFGAAAEEYRVQKRKERLKREQRMRAREAKRLAMTAALNGTEEASMLDPAVAAPVRREDMPKTELLADITRECMHLRQEIEDRIKELKEKEKVQSTLIDEITAEIRAAAPLPSNRIARQDSQGLSKKMSNRLRASISTTLTGNDKASRLGRKSFSGGSTMDAADAGNTPRGSFTAAVPSESPGHNRAVSMGGNHSPYNFLGIRNNPPPPAANTDSQSTMLDTGRDQSGAAAHLSYKSLPPDAD